MKPTYLLIAVAGMLSFGCSPDQPVPQPKSVAKPVPKPAAADEPVKTTVVDPGQVAGVKVSSEAIADLLSRVPMSVSGLLLLGSARASSDQIVTLARSAGTDRVVETWRELIDGLPDPTAIDETAPAAWLRFDAGEAGLRRIRIVKPKPGADPFAGKARAEGARRVLPGESPLWSMTLGPWLAIAPDAESLNWLVDTAVRLPDSALSEFTRSAADGSAAVLVRAHRGDYGVSGSRAAFDLPGLAPAVGLMRSLELAMGPAANVATVLAVAQGADGKPSTVKLTSWVEFAPGGEVRAYLDSLGEPKTDPFAGLAFGEPALMVALDLSPEVGRTGVLGLVNNALTNLRARGSAIPADLDAKLQAAASRAAVSAKAIRLVVGRPTDKGALGVQGSVEPAEGADLPARLAELAPLLSTVLDAAGRPFNVPGSMKWTPNSAQLAGKPVGALELTVEGESLAARAVRSVIELLLGSQGFKLLAAPTAPQGPLAFALASDAPLLEKTLAGKAEPPSPAVAQRLASMPKARHFTILFSPGRLFFLLRSFQQNALNLPPWKPMGFVAVSGRAEMGVLRLEADAPFDVLQALGEYRRMP